MAKIFASNIANNIANNNKYMITSTQITNTGIFAFIAIVVLKLLRHQVLFINKKTIETVRKLATFSGNSKFYG